MDFYLIRHWFHSIRTISYWRYALFTVDSWKTFLAVWGAVWLLADSGERFGFFDYQLKGHGWQLLIVSVLIVIWTRRPISRIAYKLPKSDVRIEIRVGDIFKQEGDLVVSTNTTFETDVPGGVIAADSLQGKFTQNYYDNNIAHLDGDITRALAGVPHQPNTGNGKPNKYDIGTVAKVHVKGRYFYLLAMAEMNAHGNTQSSKQLVRTALNSLWTFVHQRGELGNMVIPVIGTGRGRTNATREETIKQIVKSFAQATARNRFANKLTIVIHPQDYRDSHLNLFELNDYLRAVHKYEKAE